MQSPSPELRNSVVRAGAGAGKTRGLVEKVVEVYRHFHARGETPRIVLTTFTRKATQELKERLILKACAERDPGLLSFVSDPARLHISTIHGLLNIFLRQVGHLAGLDAGFQIVSEAEGKHLGRLALREVVVENPDGLKWLEVYGFERVLTMCRRFEEATREQGELQPATPEDLERAAHVEAEKWKLWLSELASDISIEVSEPSWQDYALQLKSFLAGWTGDCTALDNFPSKPRRSKKQADLEAWHDRTDEAVKEFKKEMGRPCWNRELWPAMHSAWTEFAQLGRDFIARVDRIKESQARYQMQDLEHKSVEILRAKPFLGSVFAEGWDFWMIDEYQDTSPLQVEALTALISGRPKYVVGDPQQSIYLFRGAEVRVFDEAEQEVKESGGEVRELRRNYRSSPDLLMWINDFMASLSPKFAAMEPRESAGAGGRVCARLLRAPDAESELQAVAARVSELLQEGARLEQICVLGRTHRNLMEASRALKAAGFPTHVHSSRGFSERREVIDAQALWKFLVNPHDNLNLLILLRSPWFYVEDWRLSAYMADRPNSLWRRLEALQKDVPESIVRLKEAQAVAANAGLVHAFEKTLCSAAFLDLSLHNDPAGRKESNLWKLIAKARTLEKQGGISALDFLESGGGDPLDSAEGDATSAQEPGCINLMTIHGSKGLEFEHVILPRMGESPRTSHTAPLEAHGGVFTFPIWNEADGEYLASPLDYLSQRQQSKRELEEFDRWLYVALTRAKSTLTLTWSERGRESWAERSPWCGLPAGVYEQPGYRYEIAESWTQTKGFAGTEKEIPAVRRKWRADGTAGDERQSVTDLVVGRKSAVRRSVKDLLPRWKAQTAGTLLHKQLEALRYGRLEILEEPGQEGIAYVLGLDDPPMQELVRTGYTEWGFQVQTFTGVLEGQIDLWGKHDGKIYVVDYKSGSPDRVEEAFTQLSIYAWALRRFGHNEPVVMAVIYPLKEKTVLREFSEELFARWEAEFSGT